jgi:hypothetical protein
MVLDRHGKRVARRVLGLEAALVDHSSLTIRALSPDDQRSIQAEVAGPAALLVAKVHKLHERIESQRSTRIDDKDAADVLRIMQTTDPAAIAGTLATLTCDPIACKPTNAALIYLPELFGAHGRSGITMAQRALRTAMPPERIQATLCQLHERHTRPRTTGLTPRSQQCWASLHSGGTIRSYGRRFSADRAGRSVAMCLGRVRYLDERPRGTPGSRSGGGRRRVQPLAPRSA